MKTYSQHDKIVGKAHAAYETAYHNMIRRAIDEGNGRVTPNELRKLPEYASMFVAIDVTREAYTKAQDAAVADHCAHRQGRYGDRFEWYSAKDARRFRADVRRRALGGR